MSLEPECDKLIKLTEGVKVHLDKMHSILSRMEHLDNVVSQILAENEKLRRENKYLRAKISERIDILPPRYRF